MKLDTLDSLMVFRPQVTKLPKKLIIVNLKKRSVVEQKKKNYKLVIIDSKFERQLQY